MNIVPPKSTSLMNCLFVTQNGGVGGIQYEQKDPPLDHHSMASSLDALNGNLASSENTKRPKNLSVSTLREDSEDMEDGSLPCTPELHADTEAEVSNCSAGAEVLEVDTTQLMMRFFSDYTGLSKSGWNESKELSTMKRVVEHLLEKHRYTFNGMINQLSLDNCSEDVTFVSSVARHMFEDGKTNWGRIASLVAFGAVVCQKLKERGRSNCVPLVAHEISRYLLTDQREWLVKNNSWDGFVHFFHVADPESSVRNTLMAFAGFAGIGATLAFLIR